MKMHLTCENVKVRPWNFAHFSSPLLKQTVHWDEDGLDLVSGIIRFKSISKLPFYLVPQPSPKR